MRVGQLQTQIENALGLFFKFGKAGEVETGRGIGARLQVELANRSHIIIIVGVDQVEDQLLLFRGENWALYIDPLIKVCAGGAKPCPLIGVMIDPKTEDSIVQFKQCLLDVIGDLETLNLNRTQFFAQFASSPPGAVRCPRDQPDHDNNCQNKSRQPEFDRASHVNTQEFEVRDVRFVRSRTEITSIVQAAPAETPIVQQ